MADGVVGCEASSGPLLERVLIVPIGSFGIGPRTSSDHFRIEVGEWASDEPFASQRGPAVEKELLHRNLHVLTLRIFLF